SRRSSVTSRVEERVLEVAEPRRVCRHERVLARVDVLEHGSGLGAAERLGLAPDALGELGRARLYLGGLLLAELARVLEVGAEPVDRVALAPVLLLGRGAVLRRVVA